jgi:Flp pilus assembly protein TadG
MPKPSTPLRQRRDRQRGQSLVEFALMNVFLTILLLGVVDIGRAYFTYLALKDAAAEGAYFGAAYPQCVTNANAACPSPNNIDYRVRNSSPRGLVNWSTVDIGVNAPDLTPGQSLTVTVTFDYPIITPFVGTIVGGQSIELGAQSVAVIVSNGTP